MPRLMPLANRCEGPLWKVSNLFSQGRGSPTSGVDQRRSNEPTNPVGTSTRLKQLDWPQSAGEPAACTWRKSTGCRQGAERDGGRIARACVAGRRRAVYATVGAQRLRQCLAVARVDGRRDTGQAAGLDSRGDGAIRIDCLALGLASVSVGCAELTFFDFLFVADCRRRWRRYRRYR